MRFVKDLFKRDIQKPFKQLQIITPIWEVHLPDDLLEHTRLESYARGVLHVTVDSSARLYQLDRQLRSGLQKSINRELQGQAPIIKRVKLVVGIIDPPDA